MACYEVVKATFWGDGDYGVQQPITEQAITAAEHELGVTLPAELLDLLRIQNGGQVAPDWNAFATNQPTSWSENHVPFTELMGIGRREHMTSLLDTPYLIEEWEMPSSIVLLSGDGHYWVGLDYRTCGPAGEPSVTWFDTDLDSELPLADNFRSFIENLTSSGTFGHHREPAIDPPR